MPFNIYAESIDSHIRGRNYSFKLNQSEKINTNNIYANSGIFHITFELDDNYIGYILPNYTITYKNYFYNQSNPNWGTLSATFNRRVFINGSSFSFDVPITWYSNQAFGVNGGSDPFDYDSYNVSSSDVTKTSDIDSIDQIITILTDLYNSQDQVEGLLNNQLTQLQQVVANTNLANQYLDSISKMRQWDIPMESFAYTWIFFRNGYQTIDYNKSIFQFPIYNITSGTEILIGRRSTNLNSKWYCIFAINENYWDKTSFLNGISSINNCEIESFEVIDRINFWPPLTICKMTVKNSSSVNDVNRSITFDHNVYFAPIYLNSLDYNKLSTDFALTYGLSNQLLNDIHIIANGTTQSNQQSSDLSSGTDSMQQQMNDLVGVEDSYNQQFNDSVNQIDFNNPLQQNQGLLGASNFVITVFNGLISNNPFSILIIIVCILLIGKKVIGK